MPPTFLLLLPGLNKSGSEEFEDKPEMERNLAVWSRDWSLSGGMETLPVYMNSAKRILLRILWNKEGAMAYQEEQQGLNREDL